MTSERPESPSAPDGPTQQIPGAGDPGRPAGPLGSGAKATARGMRGVARATGRASRYTVRQAQRAAQAQGAEQSGLTRLIYLHASNAAGDAAVAISLATTVFFAGADQRGARPGGAVPRPDDAPVRDRGAADRPVPRQVQPRPALGDRRDLRDPRVPLLGARGRGRRRLGAALSRSARRTRRVQGVRRDPRRRRPPTAADGLHAGEGQRPGLARGHGRRGDLRADRRAGRCRRARSGHCATRSWSSSLGTIAAIRLPEKVDSSAGEQQISLRADHGGQRRGTQIPPAVAFALRANCGPRWLSGFLILFLAFLLRGPPDRRVGGQAGAAGRPGDRRGRRRQRAGHRPGRHAQEGQPGRHRGRHAAARRGDGDHHRRLLRAVHAGRARADGRTGPVAGQAVPGRDDPGRRTPARPGQRLRPQRHHGAAGLGDRRVRRHRDAADPPPRPRRRRDRAGRLDGVRARHPAQEGPAGVGRAGPLRA